MDALDEIEPDRLFPSKLCLRDVKIPEYVASMTFAATLIMGFSSLESSAQCGGDDSKQAKLYAVKFHADYCGACKALAPKLSELSTKMADDGVEFVVFDFTSDESKQNQKHWHRNWE